MNKNFIKFWITQSISILGSGMTSYALTLWIFGKTNSVLSVSLISLSRFVPFIIASIVAGPIIDRFKKKNIILISDTIAGISTLILLIFYSLGNITISIIYICNFINGLSQAFQSPAESAVFALLVKSEDYIKASSLDSFSGNFIEIIAPMISVFLVGALGIKMVLIIDLISFLIAFIILKYNIDIQEIENKGSIKFNGSKNTFIEGYSFLKNNKGIMYLIMFMLIINLFSSLTYENILKPLIYIRTHGNEQVVSIVSGSIGFGGLIGSVLVSFLGERIKPRKMIFLSALISFLLGDIFISLGKIKIIWILAGIFSSIPIPFIFAGQRVFLYSYVPKNLQGRVFAWKNAIQMSSIPIAILLGGTLADYVFEPFMLGKKILAIKIGRILGNSAGSGMSLMFLISGILGITISLIGYKNREVTKLEESIK